MRLERFSRTIGRCGDTMPAAEEVSAAAAILHFEGDEVYFSRDDATGDIVLSNHPGAKTWNAFFELLHAIAIPADFMDERPLNVLPQEQGLFDDELTAPNNSDGL